MTMATKFCPEMDEVVKCVKIRNGERVPMIKVSRSRHLRSDLKSSIKIQSVKEVMV